MPMIYFDWLNHLFLLQSAPTFLCYDALMDLELLKTFIAVSQTQHFGKAADSLFLTQSAISARIRLLESQLNCQLFLRDSKKVQLTDEGKKFYIRAEEIMQTWALAKQELADKKAEDNTLSISSHAHLWQLVFNDKLQTLAMPLRLQTLSSDEAWLALEKQQTDLLLSNKAAKHSGLAQQALGHIQLQLVASEQYLDHFQLANTCFVDVDWGLAFEQFKLRVGIDKMPCRIHTDNAAIAVQILLQQNACAYLPLQSLAQYPQLQPINHPKMTNFQQTLYAFYNKNSAKVPRIQALIGQLTL